jgi:hypothetical protein
MKPGFWKLKVTAGIGNIRNQPLCPVSQSSWEICPVWNSLVSSEAGNSQGRSE